MRRLLYVGLAGLLSGCGFSGGDCDSEGDIEKASQLESRMKCEMSNNIIASHIEGSDSFEVLDFPELTSIKGGLLLQGFENVREIRMPNLEDIDSPNGVAQIYIGNMPALEVVQLGSLRKVSNWDTTAAEVYFGENPRLKTLELSSLELASSVGFNLLESIQTISLPALTATSIAARNNVRLESVEIGGSGEAALQLDLSDNPTLIKLSGTRDVDLSELTLSALPFFTDFDLGVKSVQSFVRVKGTGLTTLAMDDLTDVEIIEVQDNAALTSISMASLTTVSSKLFIQDNDALASLNFPAATDIGQIEIVQNPMLPECQVQGLAAQVQERSGRDPNLISRFNLADECAN